MTEFEDLHFPGAPRIVTDLPGPKTKELLAQQSRFESNAVLYPKSIPLAMEEGRGATVKDLDGNIFIDFYAGISVLNFGHSNPEIIKAAKEQAEKLVHTLDFPGMARISLSRKLCELAPLKLKDGCKVLYGSPTGSDAVECAIKVAKHNTGRHGILAFEGSYHGQSSGSLSISSTKKFKARYLPLLSEVHFAPFAYCYRCPFGQKPESCALECAQNVERILEDPYSGVVDPAAIIVEPVQGEGGIVDAPDGFMKEMRRIADDHAIPLIVDEIQAGMGRTGRMWSCEHSGASPDIMPIAKSIGGGFPLAACLIKKELDTWEPGGHVGTFRGHVVAMAAGVAALNFMEKHNVLDHVAYMGKSLFQRLEEIKEKCPYIGDVRGRGLMAGVEFVKDRNTKKPWKEIVDRIQMECYRRGLLIWKAGHYGNVARFLPPLVVTGALMEKGLDIFEEAVKVASK